MLDRLPSSLIWWRHSRNWGSLQSLQLVSSWHKSRTWSYRLHVSCHVGARTWAWALSKNSKCSSLLSHLVSPALWFSNLLEIKTFESYVVIVETKISLILLICWDFNFCFLFMYVSVHHSGTQRLKEGIRHPGTRATDRWLWNAVLVIESRSFGRVDRS